MVIVIEENAMIVSVDMNGWRRLINNSILLSYVLDPLYSLFLHA